MSRPRFLYCNPKAAHDMVEVDLPGIKKFAGFRGMLGSGISFVDRTNTIITPMRTKVQQPIPAFREFKPSYADVCNARAVELLNHAGKLDLPIYVFYSGGIDSTAVMVSLMKNGTPEQLSRVTVLLTAGSVAENVNFYRQHLLGRFKIEMSITFPFRISKKAIFIAGEFNDQLFGSDKIRDVVNKIGAHAIRAPYKRETFEKLWAKGVDDSATLGRNLDLLEHLRAACPVPIDTTAAMLWWINFTLKWQAVYVRMLTFTSDFRLPEIDESFIRNNFFHFFSTDEFQLWSMNNPDKKIHDTWVSYKWEAKEFIYSFTKDNDYLQNKTKRGSLYWVTIHQIPRNYVDENWKFTNEQPPEAWYEPENSFL